MKVSRDDVVQQLRDMGRNEDADRALEELPERFRLADYEGKLHSYGLSTELLANPGGIGSTSSLL